MQHHQSSYRRPPSDPIWTGVAESDSPETATEVAGARRIRRPGSERARAGGAGGVHDWGRAVVAGGLAVVCLALLVQARGDGRREVVTETPAPTRVARTVPPSLPGPVAYERSFRWMSHRGEGPAATRSKRDPR